MKKIILVCLLFPIEMTCFAEVRNIEKLYKLGEVSISGALYWNDAYYKAIPIADDDLDDEILSLGNSARSLNMDGNIFMYLTKAKKLYAVSLMLDRDSSAGAVMVFVINESKEDVIFWDIYEDYSTAKAKCDEFKTKYYNLIANQ